MNNDERVKEMLEKEPVPKELEPDSIKTMLDEKKADKKRSGISAAGRIAAAAAACAVIGGGSYAYMSGVRPGRNNTPNDKVSIAETSSINTEQTAELISQQAYMSGAKDYSQIYELLKLSSKNRKKQEKRYAEEARTYGAITESTAEEAAEYGGYAEDNEVNFSAAKVSPPGALNSEIADEEEFIGGMGGGDEENVPDHSDTFDQEQNVLEADIAKTDGKYIYHISNADEHSILRSAKVKDGKFVSSHSTVLDIPSLYEGADYSGSYVHDMYLYNDMIVVIGDTFGEWFESEQYRWKNVTYAAFYSTGDSPELIDVYYQDGGYSDVRIAPDGYMYLMTNYTSEDYEAIDAPDDYMRYIPQCGLKESCGLVPPEDILLPPENKERMMTYVTYSMIGSVDLNVSGEPKAVDIKALADYTGQLYSSADNIYTAAQHGQQTDLTRIAIGGGGISPAASATVDGYVKDQFSMSEYGGFFRAAVTRDIIEDGEKPGWWGKLTDTAERAFYSSSSKRDNALYVFDMDMNMVGSVEGFGETESVKSVSFQGNMAYVVTYEQTDPLFAIDLSEPSSPTIIDEFKINGYSTYMQQWSDGLLLGFGVNADENAVETGIKMVMFDNSDPDDLKEVGFWSLDRNSGNSYSWVSSQALWDRKALLIAPEKNLIGIPVECETDHNGKWEYDDRFMFFSYDNGEFVEKGSIESENTSIIDEFRLDRAVYIGSYVYVLSGGRFIAADIDTLTVSDDLIFSKGERNETVIIAETTEAAVSETTSMTETTETAAETSEISTEETTVSATTETTAE
ncbi:MAG: beta-propeller domain-containing protein [Ruminococcus sp.]|nr:beta-propeller domain-containing protein [Ruminococcus sp.]